MAQEHEGHRERLRQRFKKAGMDAFAPHEVLELLLTYAIPRRDTKPIAYALLRRFGSFHAVLQATVEELMQVDGMGESAAILVSMMMPLFRAYRSSAEEDIPEIKNGFQAVRYCESLFEGERYEKFYVVCLDTRMRRLNTVLISSGDVTEVRVYARLVLNALTQCNAMGAVLAHNHPSGTAQPSASDVELTNAIQILLDGVGIRLYDHVIVSGKESFSFRRGGLLGGTGGEVTLASQRFEKIMPDVQEEIYHMGRMEKGSCNECMNEKEEKAYS